MESQTYKIGDFKVPDYKMKPKKPTKPKKSTVLERKLGQYRVGGKQVVGFAHFDENLIEIDPRQTSFEYLETLIHEKYHLQFPKFSESRIIAFSHDMAKFLWDLNYRQVKLK